MLTNMVARITLIGIAFLLSCCSAQAGIIVSASDISVEAAACSQWQGFGIDHDEPDPCFSQANNDLASVSPPQSGGGLVAIVDSIPVPDATGLQRRLYISNDVRPLAPFLEKLPKPA